MQKAIIQLLTVCILVGCSSNTVHESDLSDSDGQQLRNIVAANYPGGQVLIGATTGSAAFGTPTGDIMDREFSYVTPENDFKQGAIHPDPDTWQWTRADAWIQHVADNGQVLRIHGPVSPQCSNWAKEDDRTPEELEQNMREYITALYQRYNGTPGFVYLDVVNETTQNNAWHTDKDGTDWEVPWYRIGVDTDANQTPLYIKMAFEIATQHAPDLKFIYNHHEDMNKEGSWRLIKDTIAYLREKGLQVDGIGWQAHVTNGWATTDNLAKLRSLIDWAHQNNLEFHVTEASVWIKDEVTEETLALQADTYSAIVRTLLEKCGSGVVGWNTWHVDDAHGWHQEWHGGLFDGNYEPKPAYYAIQQALQTGP
jgi:endo-1,4-beta-xylanase